MNNDSFSWHQTLLLVMGAFFGAMICVSMNGLQIQHMKERIKSLELECAKLRVHDAFGVSVHEPD